MKKQTVYFLIVLSLLSACIASVPKTLGQTTDLSANIKVLTYSYYYDSFGSMVVVGEAQNVGNDPVTTVGINGYALLEDGKTSPNTALEFYGQNLMPQQKAPFYMDFGQVSASPVSFSFYVVSAPKTTNYQYYDLKITSNSSKTTSDGTYWVTCNIKNTGVQDAVNVRLVGTFYNSSGSVVGMGFTDPQNMTAGGQSTFKVGAFDLNMNTFPSYLKITGYTLLTQVEAPIPQVAPSTLPTPYPLIPRAYSDNQTNPFIIYGVIIAIVAVLAVVLVLKMRSRKPQTTVEARVQTAKKSRSERSGSKR